MKIIRSKLPYFLVALLFIALVVIGLSQSCTSDGDFYQPGTGIGSSNTSPLFASLTNNLLVSVNETDVTGWPGMLADDQHVLDSEVISAIQNSSTIALTGTLTVLSNPINPYPGGGGKYAMTLNVNNNYMALNGGDGLGWGNGGRLQISGKNYLGTNSGGFFSFLTPNASYNGVLTRLTVGTGTDAEMTWTNSYHELNEISSAPGAGGADSVRIYAINNVSDNLTDLNAVFQDGTVVTFAEESTPLDSPIFRYGDNTEITYKMMKPNPALIQFVAEFPDGSQFVIKSIEYHDQEKIQASKGSRDILPEGWFVETQAQRDERNSAVITVTDNVTQE